MSADKRESTGTWLLLPTASTDLDEQHRMSGALDVPLSETGRQEAEKMALAMRDTPIDVVLSAGCLAARETAKVIAKAHRKRVRQEETWSNVDLGLWHGKCIQELKENNAKFFRQWSDHPETVSPPGGETFAEVRERIEPAVHKLVKKHRDAQVLLVAPQPLLGILAQAIEKEGEQVSFPWKPTESLAVSST